MATLTIPKTQSVYTHEELVDEKIIKWFFAAASTFLTTSMLAGLLVSLQLIANKGNFKAAQIAELAKMKTWLTDNVPADLKWDTNAAPLQK